MQPNLVVLASDIQKSDRLFLGNAVVRLRSVKQDGDRIVFKTVDGVTFSAHKDEMRSVYRTDLEDDSAIMILALAILFMALFFVLYVLVK